MTDLVQFHYHPTASNSTLNILLDCVFNLINFVLMYAEITIIHSDLKVSAVIQGLIKGMLISLNWPVLNLQEEIEFQLQIFLSFQAAVSRPV